MDACLGSELAGVVRKSRVFVVGTGGIGCELAKNLVLTGFQDIIMVRTRRGAWMINLASNFSYFITFLLQNIVLPHIGVFISCNEVSSILLYVLSAFVTFRLIWTRLK